MNVVDTFFGSAFFQLPLLEGLMYVVVVLLIGATIVGIWDRFMGTSSGQREAEPNELRRAA